MSISKMKLVNILGENASLNDVLYRFTSLTYFHPEPASKFVNVVHGLTKLEQENPSIEVLARLDEMVTHMDMPLDDIEMKENDYDLDKIKEYMEVTYQKFLDAASVRQELIDVIQENKDALIQVKNIESIDLNLDDLFECKFIKIRFGRLPIDSVTKLQYYQNRPFIFKPFHNDDTYSWCLYITTTKYEGDVDNIFSSLYFERIRIPEFVHGTPERAKESLQEEIDNDHKQLAHVEEVIQNIKHDCYVNFMRIKAELNFIHLLFEARKYVVGLGERFSITGFIAEEDVEKLKAAFADLKEVEIEVRPAHSDKRLSPPTKIKNGWFARPFSMFVEMYGTPEYGSVDPTPFLAFTYSLLFGVMFADLGQGIVLIILGYLLFKIKKLRLGEIGMRIGIISSIFGFLFGSIFGNETALTPIYRAVFGLKDKPIEIMSSEFIPILLVASIGVGVLFIICAMCINTYLQWKKRAIGEFLFSHNGLAGLVFYIAVIGGGSLQIVKGITILTQPLFVICLLLLPLVLIFLKEAMIHKMEKKEMFPEGFGAYFSESFFELFEICLSFTTNTISYLRVGGFVLSHAGMMMAVTLIMEMAGGAGFIVLILGNIFVMCLEGMIVGIQVLRLEFYEMFSRYFTGNGIAFSALKN